MAEHYNHKQIDKKWQDTWEKDQLYKTPTNPKNKKYVLDMFPYPSGAGLHVGHPEGYTATDILSRYLRMNGHDVLHPMGWDAFGLPAENYAIKQGVPPWESTAENINHFREQIKSIGLSYDWSREVKTSSPESYRWTQWLFLQLYKKGLAYKKEASVNWCPKDQTVLANEQVVNGNCERCGTPVVQKLLSQWFFKITDYADRLLNDMDKVDWPEPIRQMQKNWIGRSEGAEIDFAVEGQELNIKVFTTRPDTLFGATYIVLAPEHPLVMQITTPEQKGFVSSYIEGTKKKTELQRTQLDKKSGVFTGAYAINPATEEIIPVWIADYVLATYGTGAIMAVPAHDERDQQFAGKFNLLIKSVLTDDGKLIDSGKYDGLAWEEAKKKITKDFGTAKVQYKLRDWLVSRQRYWGAPIPIIYCDKPARPDDSGRSGGCGMQPVPEQDLPVKLPTDVDFLPTGESPIARSKTFHVVKCPNCGADAKRDSDTMDTFVDSSWYFFRFTDPHNDKEFASVQMIKQWLPVDTYVGGAEHAVLHLLYARFFSKALSDMGLINYGNVATGDEPFAKLRNQGLIMGPDGEKMSKSRGNVVNPDEVLAEFGADAFRMYEMFMGPLEDSKPWATKGIVGVRRFLDKVWRHQHAAVFGTDKPAIHKLIKKITSDIGQFKFNTAIAAFMEFLNQNKDMSKQNWETLLILLAPFAPHMTEELWSGLGHNDSIHKQAWPKHDEKLTIDDMATVGVQILGRMRASVQVSRGSVEGVVKELALADENVKKHLAGKPVAKVIFVTDKVINFVVK